MRQRYLIALGSNKRHHRHGRPERVLAAAVRAMAERGIAIEALATVRTSAPVGPSLRRYANGAALVTTSHLPDCLLRELKSIERSFGRRRGGQRWAGRVLDLDIVLWSGGAWASPGLLVPHIAFRHRDFVLRPVAQLAPGWRDPVSGLTLRQLAARLAGSGLITT